MLWEVRRPGDGVACVASVNLLSWFRAEEKKTVDLEAMYGSAALQEVAWTYPR